jgi:hypothetical protein
MAVMVFVAIVTAKHPAIVNATKKMIDEGKVVSDYLALVILPNLFPENARSRSTPDNGCVVHHFPVSGRSLHRAFLCYRR